MSEKETTTITIDKIDHQRLRSILKYGENIPFALKLALLHFDQPKFNQGGIHNRTMFPRFSEQEVKEIKEQLRKEG